MKQVWLVIVMLVACDLAAGAEPGPGIGLLVSRGDMAGLREKVRLAPWSEMYGRIVKMADRTVSQWPATKARIEPQLEKVWDLSVTNHPTWPSDSAVRQAGMDLREAAMTGMCPAAFVYLVTGDRRYADAAFEILLAMGKVNRWGWFPWEGANMPQIDAGQYFRNAAFTLDFIWDALTEQQRRQARDILAEKAVEPYFRLVLHSPGMGLHHLRSKNQGNNVLSGAMIACLALGKDYPNADIWRSSYIQTFHWILTHDVGWAGQQLESGMPGYWSISMQNLYTAATCLANTTGMDLRVHPSFMEATFNPMYHQSTVPPVGMFNAPIAKDYSGPPGILAGKPIELPHEASCGPWWYDYARRFPQSAAPYFINLAMVKKDPAGQLHFVSNDCHQRGHSEILTLLWTTPELYQPQAAKPTELFKTTDRMAMIRNGYGIGPTYLYFNGDIFLSSLNEVLLTTAGLAWHHKWHGYQKDESGVETEGEALAPSMVIRDSFSDDNFTFIHTTSGPSNITYYRPAGQDECWKHYTQRDRDILYVRDGERPGYFVFIDRVAQKDPRWHGVLWQTWNHVYNNRIENYGRFKIDGENSVRIERPNADLSLQVMSPKEVAFETETAPGMPIVNYMYDHNVSTLRMLAGGYEPVEKKKVIIGSESWKGKGEDTGAGTYRMTGKSNMVGLANESLNSFEAPAMLTPGVRYRMSICCRKSDMPVYENLAWQINVDLLDEAGNVVAGGGEYRDSYNRPGSLSLSDPRSFTSSYDFLESDSVYFDAPPGKRIAKVRGRLQAALYSHPPHGITEKSVMELGPLTIEPMGKMERKEKELFVTVATPVKKGERSPDIGASARDGFATATVPLQSGDAFDYVLIGNGSLAMIDCTEAKAQLAIIHTVKGRTRSVFARQATEIKLNSGDLLSSSAPVDLSARLDTDEKITSARIATTQPVHLKLHGRSIKLDRGLFVAGADLAFKPDPAGVTLSGNSLENQKLLAAGLVPLIQQINSDRDAITRTGAVNLALTAKVTASGQRDTRFPPQKVIDNQTAEYPADGLLDYTQGPLLGTALGGYGKELTPLVGDAMSTWPFYIRPTYWLLPYQQPGWIQLELAKESPVKLVRLLNTSNAGADDYATMKFRVQLLNAGGKVLAEKPGEFGKAFDRPFAAAFKAPQIFGRYSATFDGMLEPGIKVPFGDGWQTIEFPDAPKAKFVKVYLDSWWALGAGLNEVQVY